MFIVVCLFIVQSKIYPPPIAIEEGIDHAICYNVVHCDFQNRLQNYKKNFKYRVYILGKIVNIPAKRCVHSGF